MKGIFLTISMIMLTQIAHAGLEANASASRLSDDDLEQIGPAFAHPAFSHILPQIEKWAVCNATATSLDFSYKNSSKLLAICKLKRNDVAKVLSTVFEKTRVSDLETYYRMIFWNHVGFIKGWAAAQEKPAEIVAESLADDIVKNGM